MTIPQIALAVVAATIAAIVPTWVLLRMTTARATDGRHS